MIVDAFPFYNELEVLDIRCAELRDVVDLFVLVEAGQSFSGKEKPFHFAENKARFAAYPIHHVVMPMYPPEMTSAWDREHWSRDVVAVVLREMHAAPTDILMISDVDEIPRASEVRRYAAKLQTDPAGTFYGFRQDLSYYYVNCRCDEEWFGTKMIRFGNIPWYSYMPQSNT
jgi:hypothetical protein